MSEAILALKAEGATRVRRPYRDRREGNDDLPSKLPPRAIIEQSKVSVRYITIESDFITVAEAKEGQRSKDAHKHPPMLILSFAAGIVMFIVGLGMLAVGPFVTGKWLEIVAASALALGAISVTLSLLRGQDLDGPVG